MGSNRYLEISGKDGLEGVVSLTVDGFVEYIHVGWLKEILLSAGYTFEESGSQ